MNFIKRKQTKKLKFLKSSLGNGFFLLLTGLVTLKIIAPIFIPKIPRQPNIKEVTVIIPNGGVETAVKSLSTSGFRKINAISYDMDIKSHDFFNLYTSVSGAFGGDVSSFVETDFILYMGFNNISIPRNLPKLPEKPMVIGYTFSQCYDNGFALLLPYQLEESMITKEAMLRFIDFSQNVLKHQTLQSEAFRIFADFHSLHLLVLPCNKPIKFLPKWETIDTIENSTEYSLKQWDSFPKLKEVWMIRDYL